MLGENRSVGMRRPDSAGSYSSSKINSLEPQACCELRNTPAASCFSRGRDDRSLAFVVILSVGVTIRFAVGLSITVVMLAIVGGLVIFCLCRHWAEVIRLCALRLSALRPWARRAALQPFGQLRQACALRPLAAQLVAVDVGSVRHAEAFADRRPCGLRGWDFSAPAMSAGKPRPGRR